MAAKFGHVRCFVMFVVIGFAYRLRHSVEHAEMYFESYKEFARQPLYDYAVACSHNSFITRSSLYIDAAVKEYTLDKTGWHYDYLCENGQNVSCQASKLFEAGYRVIEFDVHADYDTSSNKLHLYVYHEPQKWMGQLTTPHSLQPLLETVRAELEKDEKKFSDRFRPPLYMNIESRFFLTDEQEASAYGSLAQMFRDVFEDRLYIVQRNVIPTLWEVSHKKRRVIIMEGNKDLYSNLHTQKMHAWLSITSFFPNDNPETDRTNVDGFSGVWYENVGEGLVQYYGHTEAGVPSKTTSKHVTRLYPFLFRYTSNAKWHWYMTRGYNFVCMNAAVREHFVEAYECWFSRLTKFSTDNSTRRFGFDGFVRRDLFETCMSDYDGTLDAAKPECNLSAADYTNTDIAAMKDLWNCASYRQEAA
eukprot:TRINITY_DN5186_c0_g2_i1.p1 TRINITY_DN5186_c0_g2~~TRINITY_DN5186_c0_g2_i1.p1  ORF type:complete len:432 (+),score=28.40 TRINITY_DN5186_c0_g2_i1:46-1296(+)